MKNNRNYYKRKVSAIRENKEQQKQRKIIKINQQIKNFYKLIFCKKITHLKIKLKEMIKFFLRSNNKRKLVRYNYLVIVF